MSLPVLHQRSADVLDLKCSRHGDTLTATIDQPTRRLWLACATCGSELWAFPVAVETLIQFKGGR